MPLQPGDRLGPYTIQALLGVGGMGEVYRSHDDRLGRDVALKVISPRLVGDPALRRRFELEARAASALNHPAIVTIYDVGESEGVSWIAMEWAEGRTLREALGPGPMALRDVVSILRQMAGGLAAAHAKGIVHRDLKPENVMLVADGRAKILDFGLARQTLATVEEQTGATMTGFPNAATLEGAILGTVGYMSPEQAAGRAVDFRSDQFALGLIGYEMLTGQRAFVRPSAVETLSAIINDEPVPPGTLRGGIPEPIVRVVARCLAKRPEDRFGSTRDLVTALESLGSELSGVVVGPSDATATWPGARPPRRAIRIGVLALAAGLALATAAGGWLWLRPSAINTLAVLPFENASQDPEIDYLVDGLTDSLIDQMSHVPSMTLLARSTVFHFKGTTDPVDVGRRLHAGAVLTGKVVRTGGKLLITAELVEIPTGARLWGATKTYDQPLADLISVQDAITSDIADGLRLRLSRSEKERTLGRHGTENPEAWELFMKARAALRNTTEDDDLTARRLFTDAIEKDPKFVDAHVGLASTYARSAGEGYAPPGEAWTKAEAELQKALKLDPANVQARAARAARHFQYDWKWELAGQEFREVSRDSRLFGGNTYHPAAMFFWASGVPDEAVNLLERGLRVDPENLESRNMLCGMLAQAGRSPEAVDCYKKTLASGATPGPLLGLAELQKQRGDITGAIDTLGRAYKLAGNQEGLEALDGARTEQDYEKAELVVARADLADAEAAGKDRYVSPLELARLYARTGDKDKAFVSLDLALTERSLGLVFLKVDRAWDRVRADSRFRKVVERVGIP